MRKSPYLTTTIVLGGLATWAWCVYNMRRGARLAPVQSPSSEGPGEATVGSEQKPGGSLGPLNPAGLPAEVIRLTNGERQRAGLSSLAWNEKLIRAARAQAKNMAERNSLSHELDGKKVGARLSDLGYRWQKCGENIAFAQRTPDAVMKGWMASPGHRGNILDPEFTEIGVWEWEDSKGRIYWGQIFARPLKVPCG